MLGRNTFHHAPGRARGLGRPLVVAALVAALLTGAAPSGAQTPPAVYDGSGPSGIDISDRSNAVALFRDRFVSGIGVAPGWTGNAETCEAGTTRPEFQRAVADRVNYFRAAAGIHDITFTEELNSRAQQAALMMTAKGELSHETSPDWPCWTPEGADGAATSNLHSIPGTDALLDYMSDYGHRVNVLNRDVLTMGTGDTDSANALLTQGPERVPSPQPTRQPFVSWPPPGHVSNSFRFAEWTFDPTDPGEISNVSVAMSARGVAINPGPISVLEHRWGFNWFPEFPADLFAGGDVSVLTTVSFDLAGEPRQYSWRSTFGDHAEVARWAGSDRYSTAASAAMENWPGGAPTAFVATGENFPDGLVAGQNAGPVLLTARDSLPAVVGQALRFLAPRQIIVLGSSSVVSDGVMAELNNIAPATRHAGADRFETAANHSLARFPNGASTVYVATGANFPDALAAGGADQPILLTLPDALPGSTRAALDQLKPQRITVLGGPSAVSDAVVAQLNSVAPTSRVFGSNRYGTAANLATALFDTGTPKVYVATALSFADALAAGGGSHAVLLVQPDGVPPETAAALHELQPDSIVILGGEGAVSHRTAVELTGFEH